jgi:hypothetical protein
MEVLEAKILLKNLLKRIRLVDEDSYELNGSLTDDEMTALHLALASLNGDSVPSQPIAPVQPLKPPHPEPPVVKLKEAVDPEDDTSALEIDTSVLSLAKPPQDRRLCLDFGTAMSKVTLVKDATVERDYEDIEVLSLGVPGDQEEVSETMLVSSVLVDDEGVLWFGQMAVERSQFLANGSERQRLDNIKRYLSEEGLNNVVLPQFNPTSLQITYGDMVLAYLMFLTWCINHCLEGAGEPRNLYRRFAMPCFNNSKARDVDEILRRMLGEAQILADTFYKNLQDCIKLDTFVEAVSKLRKQQADYPFVQQSITEPLGVAGSLVSWGEDMDTFQSLVMVVDVGAGTSDFSMYRIGFNSETGKSIAYEVEKSSECITEAGNFLDTLLKGMILKEAGITHEHPQWRNYHGNLELDLRTYKERLFDDGELMARLFNGELITIKLEEFLSLSQVAGFGESLKNCRDRILNRIDSSFIVGAPSGRLSLALTGGGAGLPMVAELIAGKASYHGTEIELVKTKDYPKWLKDDYPDLETDYSRIAVSLGGARKRIIEQGGVATITGGGNKSSRKLGGYYTKGS